MGSDSDWPKMQAAADACAEFGVPVEVLVASAHRTPEDAAKYARTAADRGLRVLIAGAGLAAHLPGVLASMTTLPVIGVPIESGPLKGMDALLAIVQMPPGIPVATVAVGGGGAKNAAVLAAQILALKDPRIAQKLLDYRKGLTREAAEKALAFENAK